MASSLKLNKLKFHGIRVYKQLKTPQDSEVRVILIGENKFLDNAFDMSISSTFLLLAWARQFKVKISVAPSLYN